MPEASTAVLGVLDEPVQIAPIEMQAPGEPDGGQPAFPNEIAYGPCRQRKVCGSFLQRQETPMEIGRSGLAVRCAGQTARSVGRLRCACARVVPDVRFMATLAAGGARWRD